MHVSNRLDKELYLRGFVKSRTVAAELIADGKVNVNGEVCVKASRLVLIDDVVEVHGEQLRYVSRGGLKLEHALNTFGIDLTGKICLDVGASTGGFTDCMLQHGASLVYAVDVGTNQLDSVLRDDGRVVSMERCDIRTAEISEEVEVCAVDVSFISLKLILPYIRSEAVVLVKPQFELGKKHKGVITDMKLQNKIVNDVREFAESIGFRIKDVIESPILGGSGNREFLMYVNWRDKVEK